MSKRILLISNSTLYGSGYLDHADTEIRSFLGDLKRVLFIPFALHNRDKYAATAQQRFAKMGYELSSIHVASNPKQVIDETGAVFIGGGNTFRLLKALYDFDLLGPIRSRVQNGMPYIGSSAGSNVAGPTIRTTNDMPIVQPPSFDALGLVSFQLNPHYLDADPNSKHMGETREADCSVSRRKRHACCRPARRRDAANRKWRNDPARLNRRTHLPQRSRAGRNPPGRAPESFLTLPRVESVT